ncbi:MAG: class I SAM-dependent methyltransferase [Hyphomicrobiales bacterium]|nr:class I SAM-dependent methyltransferase [Hyphomicrobiales bacterium]
MTQDFAGRRAAARKRLDAIDPHKRQGGAEADPFRRHWFEDVYNLAGEDAACVPWANLEPHPLLADWLAQHDIASRRALDVGCGLGDNAEALAARGAATTAFDLSPKAIDWAKKRFPASSATYLAADLFAAPAQWRQHFDLVHECYTLQALPASLLPQAAAALASFVAPDGRLLVIARARPNAAAPAGPPWPLSRENIEALATGGLTLVSVEEIEPAGEPLHWRALYRRAA